jgi:peptidoglycan/xylan/chitin deacetylase (PgdA/CDA1 family)
MSHAPLPSLHAELEAHEIAEGRRAVEEAGGAEVRYFRPPYGAYDERTIAAALTSRQEIVGWNVSAEDWRDGDPSRIARRVIAAARPVSIVLLHDGYRATIEALPQIVASYREAGYRFVTVGELLRSAA